VDAVLALIEHAEGDLDDRLVTVLRVGGLDTANAIIMRLRRVADEAARESLAMTLARLPVETFSSSVVPALEDDAALARLVLAVLPRVDRERGQELAMSLATHAAADVRVRAFQLLFEVPRSTLRFERLLQQTLDDEDPRVVECGLQHAAARMPLAGHAALAAFLGAVRGARVTPLQRRAVRLLRASGTTDARDALAAALAARTRALDAPARQVSCLIEAALQEFHDDDTAAAAARAWRRSAAGVFSWILRDTREAS